MASADLASLVRSKRVLVTVGAGGVGKTTTAAALSVAAARQGRRVLCLTIDPARRLAESLGIEAMGSDPRKIDPERFAAAGIPLSGSLTAQMLDTKRTFDELIVKHASTPAKADALLSNRLYKYISTSLAGTQEYMAMEKLVAVKDDPSYDLIVLDTPPTTNALDFLDAPQRLIGALDSAAMRWFVEAFEPAGKLSLNLLARSAAAILRGIGKITGGGFLEDMAGFLVELNDLFGGFKQRAARVEAELRGPDVAFVLVTSPSPASLHEVTYFAERLAEAGMPRGAFVVNRFRLPPPRLGARTPGDVERAIAEHGLRFSAAARAPGERAPAGTDPASAESRLLTAHADAERLAALDAAAIRHLDTDGVPLVLVPELASDVYDVGLLGALGDSLVGGGVKGGGGTVRGVA